MATKTISIRMDEQLKKDFEELCKDIGLSMSSAMNVFATRAVQENRIPFELGRNIPNEETLEAIKESEEILNHPEKHQSYKSARDLFEALDREV